MKASELRGPEEGRFRLLGEGNLTERLTSASSQPGSDDLIEGCLTDAVP